MNRAGFVISVCASLILIIPPSGLADFPAGSPEAVVARALDDLAHGRIEEFARAHHPDALKEFRTRMNGVFEIASSQGKEKELLAVIPGIKSVKELKSLDGLKLFTEFLRQMMANPQLKTMLSEARVEVIGYLDEKEMTHVVYRVKAGGQLEGFVKLYPASVRKDGKAWKMLLSNEFGGQMAMLMEQLISGKLTLGDVSSIKLEPVGHILDGKESAVILYRCETKLKNTTMSKMNVMSVKKSDPIWEAVIVDRKDEILKYIEENPFGSDTPKPAARPKAAMPERPRSRSKTSPRIARGPSRGPARSMPRPATEEINLPEGLTALPSKFFGNNRDRFQDIAPKGGILVGVRVSYIPRFGGQKISSVKPVYRVGDALVDGKRYGGLLGEETSTVAKPGYAVGAVNTHTGLTVDGFKLVYMKIEGDKLDPSDSYESPWLGDENGGSPRDVASEGKIPVGLQGRSGKEVNALGLIVGE